MFTAVLAEDPVAVSMTPGGGFMRRTGPFIASFGMSIPIEVEHIATSGSACKHCGDNKDLIQPT